jgi:type VI secretion system protein ImpC
VAKKNVDTATANAVPAGDVIDELIREGKMARDELQVAHSRSLIGEFVNQVEPEQVPENGDLAALVLQKIAQIDQALSDQVNEIMHAESFQKLEGSWRGLNYLVSNTETSTSLKLRVMHATKKELLADLEKASEFDQSTLFKKVYEEEFGTFGGAPYGCLIGDYEFGRHPQDMSLLEKISNVAAAAHAPFLSAASAKLFDLDGFTDLTNPRDLAKIFESTELLKWRAFRESEDSRYVALTLPRVLMRLPYGPSTVPVEDFHFVEDTDGKDHKKYLWSNAAYVLGQRITNAFSLHKWTAAIRGVEGGGIVQGLPAHTFRTDEGDVALKCPTEIAITDRREKELSDLGFITLCHCKDTDYAAFFGGQTTNKPKPYNTPQANANALLSSQLPYILASSRFAHYLKAIMRDKVGSFVTRENVQNYLNNWIANYILLRDDAGQDTKAKYPLREARIDVFDIPGKPGSYRAVVFLKPHFQLNELTASIRLVADLPPPAAG